MQTNRKLSTGALSDRMVNGLNKELALVKPFAVKMRMLKNFPSLRFIGFAKTSFYITYHIYFSYMLETENICIFFPVFSQSFLPNYSLTRTSERGVIDCIVQVDGI